MIDLVPRELEARAKKAGLSNAEWAERAGYATTTITRFLNGSSDPRLGTVSRLIAVIEEAERAAMP
jgi:predicted transcriptional regulator